MTLCDYQGSRSIGLVFFLPFLAACMQENQVEVGRGDENLPFEPDGVFLEKFDKFGQRVLLVAQVSIRTDNGTVPG